MLTRRTFLFVSTAIATFGSIFAWKKLSKSNEVALFKFDANPSSMTLDCGNGVKLELVKIPEGTFMMGSKDIEKPIHQVSVPSFYMGKYAVTQAEFEAVMGINPSSSYSQGARLPVEQVSWKEVKKFCQKLSQKSGKQVRLPSEAEWEYACRAGTTTEYSFGDNITTEQVNFDGKKKVDVDRFNPNPWGLYQMHGNVWELCQDLWHGNYEGAPTDGGAWTIASSAFSNSNYSRVRRGGSFISTATECRSSSRNVVGDIERRYDTGFRVAFSTIKEQNVVNELILDCGQGVILDLVKIPAGKFIMGSDFSFDEKPQHEVSLNGFLIGKYAVTQAQWEAVMGKDLSVFFKFKGSKLPVDTVRYDAANLFCENLTKITGREVRLPSEAEWEYACRAGTTTRFSFGDNITKDQVNFDGRKTVDVDRYAPNAWGIYQMHGNVYELCADIFHTSNSGGYVGAPTDGSVWEGSDLDEDYVVRGGDYFSREQSCRSASRFGLTPLLVARGSLGLRVVVSQIGNVG